MQERPAIQPNTLSYKDKWLTLWSTICITNVVLEILSYLVTPVLLYFFNSLRNGRYGMPYHALLKVHFAHGGFGNTGTTFYEFIAQLFTIDYLIIVHLSMTLHEIRSLCGTLFYFWCYYLFFYCYYYYYILYFYHTVVWPLPDRSGFQRNGWSKLWLTTRDSVNNNNNSM